MKNLEIFPPDGSEGVQAHQKIIINLINALDGMHELFWPFFIYFLYMYLILCLFVCLFIMATLLGGQ